MQVYVLDSNFFIQAYRIYYPPDVAVNFWLKIRELASQGRIISIDKVRDELYQGNDALKDWCKNNLPTDFFRATDVPEVLAAYRSVIGWAISRNSHYVPNAINEFLEATEADAFLTAYCLAAADSRILVTQEISEPNRKNKVKIPDACNAVGVSYVDTITMFRQLGATF
ncbi:DUF4411 family protein [Rhodoflexus caldus]|uniref:DUF4411 family protein n=1 Tax=Rhodoflexus caldus TaxID=2891236 RepID=UPI00202A246C|nr:DUF4411 family protein [Rhodoflexus caldus]